MGRGSLVKAVFTDFRMLPHSVHWCLNQKRFAPFFEGELSQSGGKVILCDQSTKPGAMAREVAE